ncbi:MAG TPA: hypothetical protein VI197_03945, partial [Polyangiaceae bacterium]
MRLSARGAAEEPATDVVDADVEGSGDCVRVEDSAGSASVEADCEGALSPDGLGRGAPYLRFSSRSTSRRSARRCTASSERF